MQAILVDTIGETIRTLRKQQGMTSDSQLYKQAGNAVTVNVVYEIAKRLG